MLGVKGGRYYIILHPNIFYYIILFKGKACHYSTLLYNGVPTLRGRGVSLMLYLFKKGGTHMMFSAMILVSFLSDHTLQREGRVTILQYSMKGCPL